MLDWGTKKDYPILIYLIKGKNRVIVVDSGGPDDEWTAKYHPPGHKRAPDMHPAEVLRANGVNIEDVEILINTHLHYDHCFNNRLFTKAKIFVQRREMQYAISPLPSGVMHYESSQRGMRPSWFEGYERIVPVDGDKTLFPGIRLVTLPGHTPGLQGVVVQTAKGRCLIASDLLNLYENWLGNAVYRHIPGGNHHRLEDYYTSYEKVRMVCDYILPSHDPKIFDDEYTCWVSDSREDRI